MTDLMKQGLTNQTTKTLFNRPDRLPVAASTFRRRTGSMARLLLFMLTSLLTVVVLGFAALQLRPDANRIDNSNTVRVYCAASVAGPIEEVLHSYNETYGANVEVVRTGGSGELAGQIKTEHTAGIEDGADLYLTADEMLLKKGRDEGIITQRFAIAEQRPVIAVSSDSSLQFNSLSEMVANNRIRFGVASQRAAAGKIVRSIAEETGLLKQLETGKATDAENVMMLAQALAAGSLDAAVIWDTTVNQLNQVGNGPVLKIACNADSTNQVKSKIEIGVLSTTDVPTPALKFCHYLSGSGQARSAFQKFGFQFIADDGWEQEH